jgi:LPPG:FO 2-phospho-L-lactate transferase
MSDQTVSTMVDTVAGELAFQDYFVARRCEPQVRGFRFVGIEAAQPAPGVLAAIRAADLVVIAPSNPWVSVAPILELSGVREALAGTCVVAVSPIIGGAAVKGPAAKMYAELGIQPSALAVAEQYGALLSGFVLDEVDAGQSEAIDALGIISLVTQTLMQSAEDRRRLAGEVIGFGREILGL